MNRFGEYLYTPLTTPFANRRRNVPPFAFPLFAFVVLVINVILWRTTVKSARKAPLTTLDGYQDLNNISAVDTSSIDPSYSKRAIVSSLYSESYLPGALALGQSLTAVNTSARRILTHIRGRLSERSLCLLEANGWELLAVERIPIPPGHRGNDNNGRYADLYTKMRIWTLDSIGIEHAVWLDGDVLVRKNIDELFSLPFTFAAAPDIYLGDRSFTIDFNVGVMAYKPSTAIFEDMLKKMEKAKYNLDMGDQGFLRVYWTQQAARLPYVYNANLAIAVREPQLWEAMREDVRIVHFTLEKPFGDSRAPYIEDWAESVRLQRKLLAERKTTFGGLFKTEFEWWGEQYDASLRFLHGRCQT